MAPNMNAMCNMSKSMCYGMSNGMRYGMNM